MSDLQKTVKFCDVEMALFDIVMDSSNRSLLELSETIEAWKRRFPRSYRGLHGAGRALMDAMEEAIAFSDSMKEEGE